MKLLVFDIYGTMAHFRRFYSNVTALSYRFPPRNTIAGLLAGIMGLERDSYYERFSRKSCRIGLSVKTPVRRLVFSANYLDTDALSLKRLRGGGHVPTTMEIIVPEPPHERLCYRVFFSHDDDQFIQNLWERIKFKRYVYPPALGSAFCLAEVEPVHFAEDNEVHITHENGNEVKISTVLRMDLLAPGGIIPQEGIKLLLEERLPPDFTNGRNPSGSSVNYLFEAEGRPISVKVVGELFRVILPKEGEVFGVFM